MASDLNKITLIGRLTKDAELKYTNSGFAITTMSLAVNRSVKKQDQWVEECSFFDLKLLGKRGESLNQYLQKGTQLGIDGQLVQERWEKDGQQRSKVIIQLDNIQLLGSKGQGQQQNNSYGSNNKPSYDKPQQNNTANFEDSIPF
jgi:single-strand DNA-binding protein